MSRAPAVWYAIPCARQDGGTVQKWTERGYKVAVQRDVGSPVLSKRYITDCTVQPNGSFVATEDGVPLVAFEVARQYRGYAESVNHLCRSILHNYPETQIIITGGDDIDPPGQNPYEIQEQFVQHFPDLYGVMQPTGDRWMVDDSGRSASERVAYSPWMGRAWCLEAYQGRGPLWPDYTHFYVDEDLQEVATRQGVFWQRPDLTQYHHYWGREGQKRPPHLATIDRHENWEKAKRLFEQRKCYGFLGSERRKPHASLEG